MDLKLKLAVSTLFFLMVTGTVFYHLIEGWSYVDSFYFTSITLSTIGYGDLHPTKDVSKVFTSFFAFTGVAIALYALTIVGADYFARRETELLNQLNKSGKGEGLTDFLRADKHIMNADKHIVELLKRIDSRIKK